MNEELEKLKSRCLRSIKLRKVADIIAVFLIGPLVNFYFSSLFQLLRVNDISKHKRKYIDLLQV
jgi:hypothetical protein